MSVAKHSLYNLAGSLAPMVIGLVTVPIYLSQIGVERFGILALCWVMLGQLGFLNLGLGTALAQKLAQGRDQTGEERSRLFWTAGWLNLGMGFIGALLGLAFASAYFRSIPGLPLDIKMEIGPAIPYLAATVPVAMIVSVLNGALQGREKFLAQNVINSASSVLMSVLPLLASLVLGPQLQHLIAAALAARVASMFFLYRACVIAVPVGRPLLDVRYVKPLLIFGGWITVVAVIAPLVVTIDRFVIGSLLGAAAVTVYALPYQLAERLKILPQSLVQALFPRLAYSSSKERDRLLTDSIAALSCVITPLAVLAIALVGPFMFLWVGSTMAVQSNPVAYILIAAFWANSFARIPWTLLQAEGRPDFCAKLLALNVVPYAVALYFGIKHLGVIGAAIAWGFRALLETTSLYSFTGRARVLPKLIVPAILVCLAMTFALAMPLDSAGRWLGLAIVGAVSGVLSYATAPDSLRKAARLPKLSKRIQA